jgi:hypothetical protein
MAVNTRSGSILAGLDLRKYFDVRLKAIASKILSKRQRIRTARDRLD